MPRLIDARPVSERQVVLTRPDGDNEGLAVRLRAGGYSVLIRPLLEIRPVPLSPLGRKCAMELDRFDKVVLVSRNAVKYGVAALEQFWPQWPLSVAWYGVGRQTALALLHHGLDADFPESAGSEGLIRMVDWHEGDRVLIIRGRGGLPRLREYLEDHGIEVSYLEVYERIERRWPHLGDEICDSVVVLSSGEAVSALRQSIQGGCGNGAVLVVPSDRVRAIAEAQEFKHIMVANDAGDEGTLEALARINAGKLYR
jgi:uroporphyrinogen-III synthase